MTGDDILRSTITEEIGCDFEAISKADFRRSVEALMARRGLASSEECAAVLRGSASEMQSLVEELVVPETWFFRDRGPFQFLRDWARNSPHSSLRLLSVPCSTGEEPYSIVITLLEAGVAPDRFMIDAVDISQRAIEAAHRAVYGRRSFREPWGGYRDYFVPVRDGFAVPDDIARLVQFHCDNLVHPSFLAKQSPYHVIFCRNLLIYLSADARTAVFRNVSRLLAPGGVVVVGASELPAFTRSGYEAIQCSHSFACQKASPVAVPRMVSSVPAPPRRKASGILVAAESASLDELSLETAWRLADDGSLEEAEQICDRLLASGAARPEHYFLKGLLSQAMNRLEAAEDLFRKTLYLDSDHYLALLHMSALYEHRGDHSKGELLRMRARRIAERGVESHGLQR